VVSSPAQIVGWRTRSVYHAGHEDQNSHSAYVRELRRGPRNGPWRRFARDERDRRLVIGIKCPDDNERDPITWHLPCFCALRRLVGINLPTFGGGERVIMSFPRGRGRIFTERGHAIIVARCPLCSREHRYDKGVSGGEEIEEIRRLGFTDEWLPCQMDLPGNYWRVVITGSNKGGRPGGRRSRSAAAA